MSFDFESNPKNISLRDWLAARADKDTFNILGKNTPLEDIAKMVGILPLSEESSLEDQLNFSVKVSAYIRYKYADAMLAEREKNRR